MGKVQYTVIITKAENILLGTLQEVQSSSEILRQMDFNPLTVLWDLLCTVEKIDTPNANPRDIPDYSPKDNYDAHPFYLGHKVISTLSYSKRKSFYLVIDELNRIITTNRRLKESDFEIVKQFFSLKFTYKIEFNQPNPLHEMGYVGEPEYHYLPLEYNYNYDFQKALADNESLDHRFTYSCYSLADIIFSVLHYLMLFGYKFNQCEHCGNYIANTSFKKYCNRNSPYLGYEHLTCGVAVDHLKKVISKERKDTITILNNSYPKAVEGFLREYDQYSLVDGETMKMSCHNLEILKEITSKKHIRETWYKKEYK